MPGATWTGLFCTCHLHTHADSATLVPTYVFLDLLYTQFIFFPTPKFVFYPLAFCILLPAFCCCSALPAVFFRLLLSFLLHTLHFCCTASVPACTVPPSHLPSSFYHFQSLGPGFFSHLPATGLPPLFYHALSWIPHTLCTITPHRCSLCSTPTRASITFTCHHIR